MRSMTPLLTLLIIISTASLVACDNKSKSSAKNADTQVVAIVNGEEITIHQVNFQLSRLGQMNEAQSKLASKQVLTRLVEMQLLKQQAIEQKMDKNPVLLQALESSKDQMLAQAYLESMMAKAPKPSNTEIDTFFKEHPELFENRRVFKLDELVVSIDKQKIAEAEISLKNVNTIKDVAAWIKEKDYPYNVNTAVKEAEAIPSDMLKKLQILKDGEIMLMPMNGALHVIHVAASKTVPISRANATPIIQQYFTNQNKSNVAKQEMLALNEKAKIEFVGTFAEMKKADLTNNNLTNNAKDAQSGALNTEKNAVTAATAQKNTKSSANAKSIDKGLSGL